MASIEQRSGKWRVYWRYGGKKQSTTFKAEKYALKAKAIVEAHNHRVDKWFIYNAVIGAPIPSVTKPAPASPTLREWVDVWLESKTRVTEGTANAYRRQFDLEILPAIGDKRLDQIEGIDVSRLINKLRSCDCKKGDRGQVVERGPRCSRNRSGSHGLSDARVTRYYSALHACLAYAVKEKKISDNPAARTDWIRDVIAGDDASDDGAGHVYLSVPEYRIILDRAAPDARPLLEFLAGTGARISEATAVAVSAFDPFTRTVRIYRAWKHDGKGGWSLGSTKGRNRRSVSIGQQVIDPVLPLVVDQPSDALIFRAPDGGRIDYWNFRARRWEPAVTAAMRCELHPPVPRGRQVEAAGPRCGDNGGTRDDGKVCRAKVADGWDRCRTHIGPASDAVSDCDCPTRIRKRPTLHDLRHSHVAWLIAEGMPIAAISQRIGHKSTAITEAVYAGILPEVSIAMADAVDAALRRAAPAETAAAP